MSKRFGRNQKRKLSEQLKQANQEKETYRQWYEQGNILAERNRQIVEDTARVLGSKFITLDPQSVEVETLDRVIRGWRELPKMSMNRMSFDDFNDIPSAQTVCEVMLDVLYHSKRIDHFTGDIHHRFNFADGTSAYAISRDTMSNMPREFMVRRIATECARLLANDTQSTGAQNERKTTTKHAQILPG